ncbi:hypothetical protein ACTFIR_003877 [Dictyostelium discoideum]
MNKPKIIINSHSKEEQFKLILDTRSNKDKIIKLNNSTYKINYQLSKKIHCNGKVLGKNVTLSNNNQPESHNLPDDDEDIKKQATKFVESIPSQICDMLSKTNPEE